MLSERSYIGVTRIDPGSSESIWGNICRILFAGNIAQVHGRTTRSANDQIAVLLCVFELTLRPENRSSGTAVQLPCSGVARSAFDSSAEIVNRNPSCPHRRRVGFNPNSRLGAVHIHL